MPFQLFIDEPGTGLTDQTNRITGGQFSSMSYSLMINERAKFDATFVMLAGDAYEPTVGSPVWYYETADGHTELVFAGQILTRNPHWFADDMRHTTISCASFECLFDTALAPAKAYLGHTAAAIFTDLVSPIIAGASTLIQLGSVIGALVIDKLILDGTTYVKDALDQLVTLMSNESGTNWAWGIDVTSTPLPSVYFRAPEGVGITISGPPFSLQGELLWDTLDADEDASNLVTQVRITAGADVFPPSCWTFVHLAPPAQTYTLPFAPSQVISARITYGEFPSLALAYLYALPSPGDTVTIGTVVYTFVSTIDNGVQNQIKLEATLSGCVGNIVAAINADASLGGSGYSWPTVENPLANAERVFGSWYVWSKRAGAQGDTIAVGSSTSAIKFFGIAPLGTAPVSHLNGGGYPAPTGYAPNDITLSVVNSTDQSNISQPSLLYQAGQQDVTVLIPQLVHSPPVMGFSDDPVPVFALLEVVYQRLGVSITVEDTAMVDSRAMIEHARGQHQRSITANSAADLGAAYQLVKKLLRQHSVVPLVVKVGTYRTFFHPADFLFFDITAPTTVLNGRRLVISEVQGKYVPGINHYTQYTVRKDITAISGSTITDTVTELDKWRGMAQGSSTAVVSVPVPAQPAAPLQNFLFQIFDATIAANKDLNAALPQSYEIRQAVITVQVAPITLDTVGTVHAMYDPAGVSPVDTTLIAFRIPVGTLADDLIVIAPAAFAVPVPVIVRAKVILKMDITAGDEATSGSGVFSLRLDVAPSSAAAY